MRKPVVTRQIGALVQKRVNQTAVFRDARLRDAINTLMSGNANGGIDALREHIEATTGFTKVGTAVGIAPRSLQRMFSPGGNLPLKTLVAVLAHLQTEAGVQLRVAKQSA